MIRTVRLQLLYSKHDIQMVKRLSDMFTNFLTTIIYVKFRFQWKTTIYGSGSVTAYLGFGTLTYLPFLCLRGRHVRTQQRTPVAGRNQRSVIRFCVWNHRSWILHNVFADMSDASDFCTLNLQKIKVCPAYAKNSGNAPEKCDEFAVSLIISVHLEKASCIYAKFLCSFQN